MQKPLNTDREIRAIRHSKHSTIEIPVTKSDGLILRVGRIRADGSNAKRWTYRYTKVIDGRQRRFRVPIGPYPQISLEAARRATLELSAQVQTGDAPGLNKHSGTFADLLTDYLHAQRHLVKIKERERELTLDALPVIGHMRPMDITRADVDRVATRALDRGSQYMAYRLAASIKAVFNFAIDEMPSLGERYKIETNPAEKFGRRRRGALSRIRAGDPRQRFLTDEEIQAWWAAVEFSDMAPLSKLGMQLVLLTGLRPGEVRKAERSHVDLTKRIWRIPKDHVKTRVPHLVNLSDQAVSKFERAMAEGRTKQIFPHPDAPREPVSSNVWPMAQRHLFKQWIAGMETCTIQDLRRTCATGMGRIGIEQHIIDACQARKPQTVGETTYNLHHYIPEKTEAWALWGEHIGQITG